MSKAALRSRRMRIFREPVSEDSRRSLVTLRRAVSVLCLERKPGGFNWGGYGCEGYFQNKSENKVSG